MKITKKQIGFIVAVVGALVALLSYFMVFVPYRDDTDVLENENASLRTRIDQLKQWQREQDMYEEQSELMKTDINGILAHFPSESLEEDAVLYANWLEARNSNTYISSVGMDNPEVIYEIGPSSIPLNEQDEKDGVSRTYQLNKQKITFANQFSYNGMKQFVTDIVEDDNSRSIESIVMTYDRSTGILVGTTEVNLFTVSGTGKSYDRQEVRDIPLGTDNVFGTLVSPSEQTFTGDEEAQEE